MRILALKNGRYSSMVPVTPESHLNLSMSLVTEESSLDPLGWTPLILASATGDMPSVERELERKRQSTVSSEGIILYTTISLLLPNYSCNDRMKESSDSSLYL